MRIERLCAEKYGKFDGFTLDLPAPANGSPDLHLIIGRNEAGKSTLRRGILELFYGFPSKNHAMTFRHGTETALSADLFANGTRATWRRTRGKKTPLVNAEGHPISPAEQADWLGAMTPEEFEAMFCLDHDGLRAGGESILAGQSDLGRMLFEAATGLRNLGDTLATLERASVDLIARRANAQCQLKDLQTAVKQSERARTDAEVLEPEYQKRLRERDRARKALEKAKAELDQAQSEIAKLSRQSALLPLLGRHLTCLRELQQVADGPDLDLNASFLLAAYTRDLPSNDRKVEEAANEVAACEGRLAMIAARDSVLDLAETIHGYAGQGTNPRKDLAELKRKLEALGGEARVLSTSIGFEGHDVQALRRDTPPSATLIALQAALVDYKSQLGKAATLTQQLREAEADLTRAQDELSKWPEKAPSRVLAAAVSMAAIPTTTDVATAAERSKVLLENALVSLAPWTGTVDELRRLMLPRAEQIQKWKSRAEELAGARLKVVNHIEELENRVSGARRSLSGLPDVTVTGSLEAMSMARLARDAAWSEIRRGGDATGEAGAALEMQTRIADREADALIGHADAAAQRVTLVKQIEAEEQRVTQARETQAVLEQKTAAHHTEIAAIGQSLGLGEVSLSYLSQWIGLRDTVLAKADDAVIHERNLSIRQGEIAEMRASLVGVLVSEGCDVNELAPLDLPGLLQFGRTLRDEQVKAAEDRLRRVEAVARASAQVEKLRPLHADASAAAEAATRRWTDLRAATLLPGSVSADTLEQLMPKLHDLDRKLEEIEGLAFRINQIEGFLADLERAWHSIAEGLSLSVEGLTADAVERQVIERLRTAQAAEVERREATQALQAARKTLVAAEAARAATADAIRPILNQAGTHDVTLAADLALASDRRRTCREALKQAAAAVVDAAGRPLEDVVAEMAGRSLDDLDDAKRKLDEALPTLEANRDSAQTHAEAAERSVSAVAGSSNASEAAIARAQAHAQMAELGRQYLRLRAAIAVLKRALQIYREEKQGPVVNLAGRYFKTLTDGSFESLMMDEETTVTQFVGLRADAPPESRKVAISGMSDGTRDQLYLALRLAGVEVQLQDPRRCLPVVCDDLFVHFDDGRSKAAFEALATLGLSTQVVYFTHHPHLEAVAKSAHSDWQVHTLG